MPLYKITATFEYVVVAEDPSRALNVAADYAAAAIRHEDPVFSVGEIHKPEDLPPDWDTGYTPYGQDGDKKIAEHLKEEVSK